MKKSYSPGIVIQKGNKLYIKMKGKWVTTGYNATKEGFKLAYEMKDHLWQMYLMQRGKAENKRRYTVYEAHRQYIADTSNIKADVSIYNDKLVIDRIVDEDVYLTKENVLNLIDNFKYTDYENLSINTKQGYLHRFIAFIHWCQKKEMIEYFKMENYKNNQLTEKLIIPYQIADVKRIIEIARKPPKDLNCKPSEEFANFLEFLFSTGWRVGEALRFKKEWISNDTIHIPNKIYKTQTDLFPLTDQVKAILIRQELLHKDKPIEKIFKFGSGTASSLARRLTKIEKYIGCYIPRQRFHRFRTTFINMMIDNGLSEMQVRKIARHKNIGTTIRYYEKKNTDSLKHIVDEIIPSTIFLP